MTYQARPIQRRRRTKTQVEQLDRQILEVLEQDHPQSVRHVFYQMTDPRLPEPIEKSDRAYNQVQHLVKELRRSDRLPYAHIIDTTRREYHADPFSGAGDFLRRVSSLYRSDIWRQSSWHVEVWCESRSIAGVIQDSCKELAVSLYPTGGFASITLVYETAEYLNAVAAKRDVAILYIADFDPVGVLIDKHIEKELREHLASEAVHAPRNPGRSDRQFDLPTKPRKAGDRRFPHVTETVEVNAMPSGTMRRILRDQIEAFLPPDALSVAKVAEESKRAFLLDWASEIGG